MKGNIKKLTVQVIIIAIAIFFVVAMASAKAPIRNAIRGQYSGTGGGSCIVAPGGFYPACDDPTDPLCGVTMSLMPNCQNLPVPPPPPPTACAIVQSLSREVSYTFKHDGTGSATASGHAISQSYFGTSPPIPPNPITSSLPYEGSNTVAFTFTYEIDDSGMITITPDDGTYISTWTSGPAKGKILYLDGWELTGQITPDGKVITIGSGTDNQIICTKGCEATPKWRMICNFPTVLIWQHE